MSSVIYNLLNKSIPKKVPQVLNLVYDGAYDSLLTHTNAHCTLTCDTAVLPPNLLNRNKTSILSTLDDVYRSNRSFDCVMAHTRAGQLELAKKISYSMHIPLILVDHLELEEEEDIDKYSHTINDGNITVAAHKTLANKWKSQYYIPFAADKLEDKEKTIDAAIIGQFKKDEYGLINNILEDLDNCIIIGDNPGLSVKLEKPEEYNNILSSAKIYINICTQIHVPHMVIQAMAAGCAIISDETPLVKEALKDTAIFCDDVNAFKIAIKKLLTSKDELEKYKQKSLDALERDFKVSNFISQWNNIFDLIQEEIFIQ